MQEEVENRTVNLAISTDTKGEVSGIINQKERYGYGKYNYYE